jgi:hypothetical protein
VSEIDKVTRQNAAHAEESAAAWTLERAGHQPVVKKPLKFYPNSPIGI